MPPDLRDLNYTKYVEQGDVHITEAVEYHSHNTTRLDVPEMIDLLLKLPVMRSIVDGNQGVFDA